jgi:hypothetical protein
MLLFYGSALVIIAFNIIPMYDSIKHVQQLLYIWGKYCENNFSLQFYH